MPDATAENLPDKPDNRPLGGSVLLPPLLFLGAMIMGADFTAISLAPLRKLNIPYPKAMEYAHLLIPGSCALLWLATVRKWPRASPILTVLLCFALVGRIPSYAERRIARLPVTRWLETDEAKSFESRNGFPIAQIGSNEGEYVIVAPQNEIAAHNDLIRLHVLRQAPQAAEK